ncbi:hypothetical protein SEA_MADAMATO_78 [Streptomyces phage Madamato]|nr:hypothetical protein SEA_MADAMATO_78 [Streptomyces phage Madamato]
MTEQKTYVQGPEADKMSNLITVMTIAGAPKEEIERAVKHSLVTMDYEKSARDNGIDELLGKYPSISYTRYARHARRMLAHNRYTIKEVSEVLEIPEETIRAMIADGSS